jgi:hypothetical protein
MTTDSRDQLASEVVEEMNSHFLTANSTRVAELLWNEVFTVTEKANLPESLDAARRRFSVPQMWMRVRGGTLSRAVVDILHELDLMGPHHYRRLLRQLGEEGEDTEATIRLAVSTAKLVVEDSPRRVHWEGCEVPIDWRKLSALWEYFLAVCQATKMGGALDPFTFGSGDGRTLIDRKNKLRSELADVNSTLAQQFVRGQHQLDLPRSEIRIFERIFQEEFREWLPVKGAC